MVLIGIFLSTADLSFPPFVTYLTNALCNLFEKYIPFFPSTLAILGLAFSKTLDSSVTLIFEDSLSKLMSS